jgi:AbrB family looped-hinge helix DNA binding protein
LVQKEEADVTVVSEKGQVVIPQTIRKRLGIGPKTKLLVYGYEDAVIMKKLTVPDVARELEAMYRRVDKRMTRLGELTGAEVDEEIQRYRRERRRGT